MHIVNARHCCKGSFLRKFVLRKIPDLRYLSIDNVFESRLTHLGVDLMVSGVRELRSKGIVESQSVAEVS